MMVMITVATCLLSVTFLLLYDGDDDVQRSPPNPAPAGSSDARRCDGDGPENRLDRIRTMAMRIDMTMVIIIMTVSINHYDHCNNDNDCIKDDGETMTMRIDMTMVIIIMTV